MVTTTSQALDLAGLPEITEALAAGAERNDRDANFPAAASRRSTRRACEAL
jgi:hypothetical protein